MLSSFFTALLHLNLRIFTSTSQLTCVVQVPCLHAVKSPSIGCRMKCETRASILRSPAYWANNTPSYRESATAVLSVEAKGRIGWWRWLWGLQLGHVCLILCWAQSSSFTWDLEHIWNSLSKLHNVNSTVFSCQQVPLHLHISNSVCHWTELLKLDLASDMCSSLLSTSGIYFIFRWTQTNNLLRLLLCS